MGNSHVYFLYLVLHIKFEVEIGEKCRNQLHCGQYTRSLNNKMLLAQQLTFSISIQLISEKSVY